MGTAIRQSINQSVLWTFKDVTPPPPRSLPRNVYAHSSGFRFGIQVNGAKHVSITYPTVEMAEARLREFKKRVGV